MRHRTRCESNIGEQGRAEAMRLRPLDHWKQIIATAVLRFPSPGDIDSQPTANTARGSQGPESDKIREIVWIGGRCRR